METFLTNEMFDTYLEMCLGALALRTREIQEILPVRYPEPAIASSYKDQDLIMNVRNIIKKIKDQGWSESESLRRAFTEINKIFLISNWEILKQTTTYNAVDKNPDIQFYRHIRNGCAHDNIFNFDELKYPAEWRDKIITSALKGTPVIPDFIKDGDPLILLVDITNKYYKPISLEGFKLYST